VRKSLFQAGIHYSDILLFEKGGPTFYRDHRAVSELYDLKHDDAGEAMLYRRVASPWRF
jgi:hypothetical protein